VADRVRLDVGEDGSERDLPASELEAGDLAEQHAHAGRGAEDQPQRNGDLARGQRSGRDLIVERLKQVVVVAVDEGDVDVGAGEGLDRLDPPESAPDDDHVMTTGRIHPPSIPTYAAG